MFSQFGVLSASSLESSDWFTGFIVQSVAEACPSGVWCQCRHPVWPSCSMAVAALTAQLLRMVWLRELADRVARDWPDCTSCYVVFLVKTSVTFCPLFDVVFVLGCWAFPICFCSSAAKHTHLIITMLILLLLKVLFNRHTCTQNKIS